AAALRLSRGEPVEHRGDFGGVPDEREGRRRYAMVRQKFLRPRLVETERERERIGARVGDAEKFANCGNVRFAIRAAQSLRNVEDDVRLSRPQPLRKVRVGLETD